MKYIKSITTNNTVLPNDIINEILCETCELVYTKLCLYYASEYGLDKEELESMYLSNIEDINVKTKIQIRNQKTLSLLG